MLNNFTQSFMNRANGRYNKDSENMTHGEWMCANTTLNKKPFSFERYPFQEQIANDMHPDLDCIKPSQVGLALALNTPIPTSVGWSSMQDLKVGDNVFDENGQPCTVTYKSPVWLDRDCYEITFCTGEKIVCDGSHRWYVEGYKAFNQKQLCFQTGRLPVNSEWTRKGVVDTEMLSKNFAHKGRNVFAIPCAKPLATSNSNLLIPPYFLGYWLGDGNAHSSTLTVHLQDRGSLFEKLSSLNLETSLTNQRGNTYQYNVGVPRDKDICRRGHSKAVEGINHLGGCKKCHRQYAGYEETEKSTPHDTMYSRLVKLNLIANKHIPQEYLRAGAEDRFELLRGLLDSDGSITKKGRTSFHNTDEALVSSFIELATSLGFKPNTRWRKPTPATLKSGHVINSVKPIAEVSFMAYENTPVFFLPRKLARQPNFEGGRTSESFRRRIVNVVKVDSVPTQCITVDSPNHLFLCGKGMIPTHNTEISIRKALTVLSRLPNTVLIYTMPNERMFKRISKARIQPLMAYDKAFRQEGGDAMKQSMDLMRVGGSFLYVTGSAEADATSINADFVFNDEIDLTPPDMLSLFNSRLQGSDLRVNQRFSTPTYEGYGIDKGYARSDQHEYVIKCKRCNHTQIPQFNRDFVRVDGMPDSIEDFMELPEKLVDEGKVKIETARVICEKCHRDLDLSDYENRSWVAKYPSRVLHRGYRVRTFSTHRLDPIYVFKQMYKYLERNNPKGFKNTVIGEPYTNADQKMSLNDIAAALGSPAVAPVLENSPYFLGVDIGKLCHLVVGRPEGGKQVRVVEMLTCPASSLEAFIKSLEEKYTFVNGMLDRYPYTTTVDGIRDASEGKFLPAHYGSNKPVSEVKDAIGNIDYANINRTYVLDKVFYGVGKRELKLEGYGNQKSIIETHLQDMVREENEEKAPIWLKLNGDDHYFHALAYMYGAMAWYQYLNETEDFTNLTLGLTGLRTSSVIVSGESKGIFGTTDLIGFGGNPSEKPIITRHN